jgi:heterodisulfide reductase subunit B
MAFSIGIYHVVVKIIEACYILAAGDKNSKIWKLKHNVIEGINELLEEIDNYHAQVAEQALQHIHEKYV